MTEHLRLRPDSPVGLVIAELRDRIDPANPPMLIGAEARDILHAALGHSFANRATEDVDLAFAITDWPTYSRLIDGLSAIPDSGIAFRVAGIRVDMIAFGSVESPEGTVTPPVREADPLDVFGMTQVYAAACTASLGENPVIRVPTVGGYVALKLKAWIDRSAIFNYKDAPDVGLALYWAAESRSFADRFWNEHALVDRWEADAGLGGAALMGDDVRQVLGAGAADVLAGLFTPENREILARSLHSSQREFALGDLSRRVALLDALSVGLRGS